MKSFEPFAPIKFFSSVKEVEKHHYQNIVNQLAEANIYGLKDDESSNMKTDYFAADLSQTAWNTKMDLWTPFLLDNLHDQLAGFLKEVGATDLAFTDIWTQVTNGFQMHHPHHHGFEGYSFVWYVDVDPHEHEGTFFYCPNNPDESYQLRCTPGLFVVWPSRILHYQPPSNSNVDRCVISGNIKVINE